MGDLKQAIRKGYGRLYDSETDPAKRDELARIRDEVLAGMADEGQSWVRFEDPRTGRAKEFGPFPFVQLTYSVLRVGPDGDELAGFVRGEWELASGETYSDVVISSG
jgi:hypothetical protein